MKLMLAALAAVVLTGCGPQDLTACKLEASKAPSAEGALMASHACDEKYAKPWEQFGPASAAASEPAKP